MSRKQGEFTGYEIAPNGNICIADVYREEVEKLNLEQSVVNNIAYANAQALQLIQRPIEERRKILWEKVQQDYAEVLKGRAIEGVNTLTGELHLSNPRNPPHPPGEE